MSHVITSYSIHYTKLYDTCKRAERDFLFIEGAMTALADGDVDGVFSDVPGQQTGMGHEPRNNFV